MMSVSVCLSVCLSAIVSPELHVQSSPDFVHITYGHGLILFCQCSDSLRTYRFSDTLCSSSFMDDVIFAHKLMLDVAAQLKRSAHAALGLAIKCAQ